MWRSYLKIAVRNLLRDKLYSAINVFGIAAGMVCCLAILLYVEDELSYDEQHSAAERIYRVVTDFKPDNGPLSEWIWTPYPLAEVLEREFPEVEKAVRLRAEFEGSLPASLMVRHGEDHFRETIFWTEPEIFEVFSLPLVEGDPRTALAEPFSIVVSETMAGKIFGDGDAVGEVLEVDTGGSRDDYRVTGVMADLPASSHLTIDALATTIENLYANLPFDLGGWVDHSFSTYVLLAPGHSAAALERKLAEHQERFLPQTDAQRNAEYVRHLQPITSIHFHSDRMGELKPPADIRGIYILAAVAVLTLLVACFNFMNLATARAARRAKEVGVRKVVGAHRRQLTGQFLAESIVTSMLALVLAVVALWLLLPLLNRFLAKELALDFAARPGLALLLLGFGLLVGVLAGSYPAFFLAAFRPVEVLGGSLRRGLQGGWVRRLVVTTQFVITIVVLVGTLVVYSQLRFMRRADLGFDPEGVVVLPMVSREVRERFDDLRRELLRDPRVASATGSWFVPGNGASDIPIRPADAGEESTWTVENNLVSYGYTETFGIEMVAGRGLSEEFPTDPTDAVLVSEATVEELGWESPQAALGRALTMNGRSRRVVGVFGDYHFRSLHDSIDPLILVPSGPRIFDHLSVRLQPGDPRGALAMLEETWRRNFPDLPFSFSFLRDDLAALYREEQRLGQASTAFALLTVAISCLGLLGLAAFACQQRTREVGVRRVVGATPASIVLLLSKEFAWLLVMANAIAWPLAYWAVRRWLDDFAYRIEIGVAPFLLAGLVVLAIAWLTVSVQAARTASARPADALRYE